MNLENAMPVSGFECLLNEHDVARISGVSLGTVRRLRQRRKNGEQVGAIFIAIGSSIKYHPNDVRDWLGSLRNIEQKAGQQRAVAR